MFCTYEKSKPITSKTVRIQFKEVISKSNINKKITLHGLRHAFATHSLEDGTDIFTIKELLGHKCINSTAWYIHLVDYKKLGAKSPWDV